MIYVSDTGKIEATKAVNSITSTAVQNPGLSTRNNIIKSAFKRNIFFIV